MMYKCGACNSVVDENISTGECVSICECGGIFQEFAIPIIESDIKDLVSIKKEKSLIEKSEKEIADRIKKLLVTNKITSFKVFGEEINMNYQQRSTMNEDKLVEIIEKKLSVEDLEERKIIITKKSPNSAIIKDLISEGKLTLDDLAECTITNIVAVMNVVYNEKKKKTTANPFI